MAANKIILTKSSLDKELVIPIQMTWDFADRSDSLIEFENKAISEVINQNKDYEVARFAHEGYYDYNLDVLKTDINYTFNFVPSGASVYSTTWLPSYVVQGFTPSEVYYYANSFKNSFFKLDFYDTTDLKTQTNYLTAILPTEQGKTSPEVVNLQVQNIKTPQFQLDYVGDKEGFFIYWLKDRTVLDVETFYMTAKFFDGKNGNFIKMMTRPQSVLVGDKFNFPQEFYFYYKVVMNYNNYTYKVYDFTTGYDIEVGNEANPINWYEYINP
jgi:hypothetical protein